MKRETRKALLGTLLWCTMMWMSCSTVWIGEAERIVVTLIPATTNLVTLAATQQGKNISPADARTIQNAGAQAGADLQLMQSLITEYQKADASAQPGLLNQIEIAMREAQATLTSLLPALHIKDAAMQAKIAAVIGVLLSEVQSVAAIMPLVNTGSSPETATTATKQVRKKAPLTANEFVSSYNAVMTAKTGEAELDQATAGRKIYLHGRFARWTSAGLLK
jgi:hypothetical protein